MQRILDKKRSFFEQFEQFRQPKSFQEKKVKFHQKEKRPQVKQKKTNKKLQTLFCPKTFAHNVYFTVYFRFQILFQSYVSAHHPKTHQNTVDSL